MRRVALLQLHNSITARRGDEPTSLTPEDVLGRGGVLEAFRELQAEGVVGHPGLTTIGQPSAMREVVRSGGFDTLQVPYNLLNASAGHPMPTGSVETDYGNIIADCATQRMGVFGIRVFAGGALLDAAPSPHILKTPFFPLDLYERDRRRAARLRERFGKQTDLGNLGLRFVLSHPHVSAAIVGFRAPAQIDEMTHGGLATLPGERMEELIKIAATPLSQSRADAAG